MSMKTYGKSGSSGVDLQGSKQRKNIILFYLNVSNAFFFEGGGGVRCLSSHLKNQFFAQS